MSELVINQVRKVKVSDDPLIFARIRCQCADGKISISAEPEKKDPDEFAALVVIDRVRRSLVDFRIPHETCMRRHHDTRREVVDRIRLDLRTIKCQGVPIWLYEEILPLETLKHLP